MDVRRPPRNRSNAVPAWLAVSVLVHVALAFTAVGVHIAEFSGTTASPLPGDPAELAAMNATPIDVSMIDLPATTPEREQKLAEEEQQKIEEKKEEEKQDEEKTKLGETVVDIPRPAIETRPAETEHRAEYDNSVEKETIHRGIPVPSG